MPHVPFLCRGKHVAQLGSSTSRLREHEFSGPTWRPDRSLLVARPVRSAVTATLLTGSPTGGTGDNPIIRLLVRAIRAQRAVFRTAMCVAPAKSTCQKFVEVQDRAGLRIFLALFHLPGSVAVRLILTLAIFMLDLWALGSIIGARASTRAKVGWIVAVVALPLAGVAAWWLAGPKASLAR